MSLALALMGCGAVDWAWERYVEPPPPPPAHVEPPRVRLSAPQPIGGAAPVADSRPEPPPSPLDADACDDLSDGGPIAGPDCVTAVIQCNTTVIGHTGGGTQRYDSEWYDAHMCTPGLTNHDGGGERTYRLDVPDGDQVAFVTLYTPCADLDVSAYLSQDADRCPTVDAPLARCEMNRVNGRQMERLVLATQHRASWYLTVEGVRNEEGVFALAVQCRPGLW